MIPFTRFFIALLICQPVGFLNLVHGQAPADPASLIRTQPAPKTPRINGPRIFGARPGHPFLYHLPVTGDRPITFSAEDLPEGLVLDKATGNITGNVANEGRFPVRFTAKNTLGEDNKTITFVVGRTICLTPPLGWNSWNCFGGHIDESKIRGAADAMVKTGLIDHGWTYINMDDRWEGDRGADGKIQSSKDIPDMKGMADYIHGLGLKVGLYSSPGPLTCAGAPGSYQHEDQDAQTYADWGIDYLKYDWCSYDRVAVGKRAEKFAVALPASATEIKQLADKQADLLTRYFAVPHENDPPHMAERDAISREEKETRTRLEALYHALNGDELQKIWDGVDREPYYVMNASLKKVNRDIVYSFCQYGMASVETWGADAGGNTWRVTGDIGANWRSVEEHGFELRTGFEKWAGPGHWNDPDMLEIGNGSLTPDENYTHMTLWCMLAAPLLIGCDMPKMTPFTVSLFSNDEVLAVNQDSLGKQGTRLKQTGKTEVWVKPLDDGTLAVAFFNRGEAAANVTVSWSDLGLQGKQPVRDLWRQEDMGAVDGQYSVNVAVHGAELFKIGAGK
jgi:alpha-galactosidase